MNWEILHIPEKPESAIEQTTVDVTVADIEPQSANTLVRKLNQVAPLENLRHVKRVRKKVIEGKAHLSVVLCLSTKENTELDIFSKDVIELIKAHHLQPYLKKVAKYAARSKEEWEEQCKLWPTSYHPPTYNISGISGFNEEESQAVFKFMKVAINLAKLDVDQVTNAAVIVDPSNEAVISTSCDQTFLWSNVENNGRVENGSNIMLVDMAINNSCADEMIQSKNFKHDEPFKRCYGASCMHPWGWASDQSIMKNSLRKDGLSYQWHPLRHAALVAIENAAARDKRLFPNLSPPESQSPQVDHIESSFRSCSSKRLKTSINEGKDTTKSKSLPNVFAAGITRPYLCTGFDIYLAWEPCTMCAMALVHQRIRRIYYAFPNPNAGALGSVYRLQGERSLNHHYAVFRVVVPSDVVLTPADCTTT